VASKGAADYSVVDSADFASKSDIGTATDPREAIQARRTGSRNAAQAAGRRISVDQHHPVVGDRVEGDV
jgi:hypothetical protein